MRSTLALAFSTTCLVAPVPAMAQDAAAQTTAPAPAPANGDIVVTAQKRAERLQGNFVQAATDLRVTCDEYLAINLRAGARRDGWSLTGYIANAGDRRGGIGGDTRSLRGVSAAASPFHVNHIRPRTCGRSIARPFL